MNRRGTEPYARWCGRTAGVIPPPTRSGLTPLLAPRLCQSLCRAFTGRNRLRCHHLTESTVTHSVERFIIQWDDATVIQAQGEPLERRERVPLGGGTIGDAGHAQLFVLSGFQRPGQATDAALVSDLDIIKSLGSLAVVHTRALLHSCSR